VASLGRPGRESIMLVGIFFVFLKSEIRTSNPNFSLLKNIFKLDLFTDFRLANKDYLRI